jgi:hypothetical protein
MGLGWLLICYHIRIVTPVLIIALVCGYARARWLNHKAREHLDVGHVLSTGGLLVRFYDKMAKNKGVPIESVDFLYFKCKIRLRFVGCALPAGDY